MTPKIALAAAVAALAAGLATAAGAANPNEARKVLTPADQARAKAIVLKLADLPGTGWKSEPSGSDSSTPRCSVYNPKLSDLTEHGDASSPYFSRPDGTAVSSNAAIFASAGQAATAWQRLVRPALARCLVELFRQGAGPSAHVTIVSSGALAFPRVADRVAAYRLVARVPVSGGTIATAVDVVLLGHGRVDCSLLFVGFGKPLAPAVERALAAKVAARMRTVP